MFSRHGLIVCQVFNLIRGESTVHLTTVILFNRIIVDKFPHSIRYVFQQNKATPYLGPSIVSIISALLLWFQIKSITQLRMMPSGFSKL